MSIGARLEAKKPARMPALRLETASLPIQHNTPRNIFCLEVRAKAITVEARHGSVRVVQRGHDESCPCTGDTQTRLARTCGGVKGYGAEGPDFECDGLVANPGHESGKFGRAEETRHRLWQIGIGRGIA
jgi:hypothetical protein